ncbi:amidohydrolase family protein [Xanthobacter sp. KR7-225]|uniref:amidohydrolase family protein n=1 Tax=Xanthobacter sp. KR7-225 TaxID=3156613 RepID=UPI0032B4659C
MGVQDSGSAARLPAFAGGAVDTHAHVFAARLGAVTGARYAPAADAPLADYLGHLDAHALAGAILVQPSFLGTDNGFLLNAVAQAPARLRAVVVVDPGSEAAALGALAAQGAVGVRLNLIGASTPDLAAPLYAGLLARLRRAGLYLEIHAEGGQWAQLLPPARAAGVVVLIDHFGRPGAAAPGGGDLDAVLGALADERVFVKLSAPYRFPADPVALAALFLARAPGRVVWGSDWPFTQHPEIASYAEARGWLDRWIVDPAVRARVLDANVRALLAAAAAGAPVRAAQSSE